MLRDRNAKLQATVGGHSGGTVVAPPLAAPVPAATTVKGTTFKLRFRLPDNAMANGTNPLGLLDELRELGDCHVAADLSTVPALDEIAPLDPRAKAIKPADMIDRRYLNELQKSGAFD